MGKRTTEKRETDMKNLMTRVFGFLIVILSICAMIGLQLPPAQADVQLYSGGTNYGIVTKIDCSTGLTCSRSGQSGIMVATGTSATPTITGGTANGIPIGTSTPSTGAFTTLKTTGNVGIGTVSGSTLLTVGAVGTQIKVSSAGVVVDDILYTKDSGAYPVHLAKVGLDGTIYGSGNGTVLRELGLVNASKGTGAGRMVCASTTDGAIYTIGSGSCF
jgi:hypothetical protein